MLVHKPHGFIGLLRHFPVFLFNSVNYIWRQTTITMKKCSKDREENGKEAQCENMVRRQTQFGAQILCSGKKNSETPSLTDHYDI